MPKNWFRKKWEGSWKSEPQIVQAVTENVPGSKKKVFAQEISFQCLEI